MNIVQQTPPLPAYTEDTATSHTNRPIAVSINNLTKQYDEVLAVNRVTLTVYEGDVYGLLGPNGAGKTTLIAMLLGLVYPTAGTATIYSYDVQTERANALQHVGAMVENPAFYPYLTGYDNLRVLGGLRGPLSPQRIREVLELVGLAGHRRKRFANYSLGMKQRLAIGLTLIHNPKVLILDEPTNGLDPHGMVEIRELVSHLSKQGHTIILCSHLLHEVEQICNRVAILRKGQVVIENDVKAVIGEGSLETSFLELTG